ncbi:MAG TPA: hypothetical protein VGE21_04205 [Flavobacteriales bacterium]
MRHLFLSLFVLLLHAPLLAQDALDKIAMKACTCVAGLKDVTNEDERNSQMGVCMLAEASLHEKELKKKHGFDLSKIDTEGEALGRAVGVRMAKHCPEVLLMMAQLGEDGEDLPPPPPDLLTKTMMGKLVEVRKGEFLTLVVRSETGSTYELLVLGPVENGGELLNAPDPAVGRSMAWSYDERELYDVRSGSFRSFKVLRALPQ